MSKHWQGRKKWLMIKVTLAHMVLLMGLRLAMRRWIWKLIMRPTLFAFTTAEEAGDLTDEWLAQLCKLQRHIERFQGRSEDETETHRKDSHSC